MSVLRPGDVWVFSKNPSAGRYMALNVPVIVTLESVSAFNVVWTTGSGELQQETFFKSGLSDEGVLEHGVRLWPPLPELTEYQLSELQAVRDLDRDLE